MAGERWLKEAEDLRPVGTPGRMEGGTPRVTLHVTVSKPGSFEAMVGVLTRAKAEPHFLYDPANDRLGQFFPLDVSARALRNDGTRRTNGHGAVNIQIEVCAMPTGFTKGWTPGPNWLAMLRAIRSWDVPDLWPAGRLSRTSGDRVDRTWASYSKAGWFGHCNVPGNDHWDPGPIDQTAVFGSKEWYEMTIPDEDLQRIADRVWATKVPRPDNTPVAAGTQLGGANINAYRALQVAKAAASPADIAAAILPGLVAALPTGAVSDAQLEAALRKVLGSVDDIPEA